MNTIQISDWHKYLSDGNQFLKTARGAYTKEKKAFSPETLYNIICMAIEKFVMAYLMKNGDLAVNHTMTDLVETLEKYITLTAALKLELQHLDSYQDICEFDNFTMKKITVSEVGDFLDTAETLRTTLSFNTH